MLPLPKKALPMTRPYRQEPSASADFSPAKTLVFDSLDREARRSADRSLLGLLAVPLLAGALARGFTDSETLPLVAMVASAIALGIWWSRRRAADKVRLEIDNGELHVQRARMDSRVKLADLLGVEFETKTIQRVEEGGSMIMAMRIIDSRVGVEVDTSRVVLRTTGPRILLGEAFISHTDTTETVGKVRVFLRKHGWLPQSERSEEVGEDESV
jgi:hypothetical protein